MSIEQDLLVIGYGNTLRGDDGAGPRVAEAVAALGWPGVRTLVCQQLSPEHAGPVSCAGRVVFVDAALDSAGRVELRQLAPSDSAQLLAHAAHPCTILALARDVFGRAPSAWWLVIPAKDMGFGEQLSAEGERGVREALAALEQLWRKAAEEPRIPPLPAEGQVHV